MRSAAVMLLLLAGCASSSSLLPSGQFELVAYNGSPLPAPVSALPTADGSPAVCALQLISGRLSLDATTQRFTMSHSGRDSCSGRVIATHSISGALARNSDRVTLTPDGASVPRFTGAIVNDQLLVREEGAAFVFQIR